MNLTFEQTINKNTAILFSWLRKTSVKMNFIELDRIIVWHCFMS